MRQLDEVFAKTDDLERLRVWLEHELQTQAPERPRRVGTVLPGRVTPEGWPRVRAGMWYITPGDADTPDTAAGPYECGYFELRPVGRRVQVLAYANAEAAGWLWRVRDELCRVFTCTPERVTTAPGDAVADALPPVTDPTDLRILELVTRDPDLKDQALGQQLGLSRQAVNERRRKLQAMGYTVR